MEYKKQTRQIKMGKNVKATEDGMKRCKIILNRD